MNLIEKLNSIDIKDVNPDEILEMLRTRLDITINIICVFATLISIALIYNNYKASNQSLSAEITRLNETKILLEKQTILKQVYGEFLASFPQELQRDKIADILSEYATIRNINIQSFAPAKEKKDRLKIITNINIKISSNTYKNIILFIKDIENSPYALRVERWSGKLKPAIRRRGQSGTIQSNAVIADVHIGALTLIND